MSEQSLQAPRVARIEIHYEDGSKDEIVLFPKHRTRIPIFVWSRTSAISTFKHARTNSAVAAVLFQTALTRRLMNHEPRDKDTLALLKSFYHIWSDSDYPPPEAIAASSDK